MLSKILHTFILLIFLVFPAQSQELVDIPSIRDVISNQFDAFQAKDHNRAYGFASPNIQQRFGSPENFGAMVRNGYPMIWSSEQFTFIDQEARGSLVWQQISVTDVNGTQHWFAYEMIKIKGEWRINGVYPTEAPMLST